jgi:hypothetical protein
MKRSSLVSILVSGLILAWLVALLPTPVHAAEGLVTDPSEGKIGDIISVYGFSFSANSVVTVYLSSQEAEVGERIDEAVTAYQQVALAIIDSHGSFEEDYNFSIPDALIYGPDSEDVHDGDYYLYATYGGNSYIVAIAEITITDGSISLNVTEGIVGTEVEVSGLGLRPNQAITIKFDEEAIGIADGDSQTDDNGDFSCTVIIPPSSTGEHIITAVDESGDTPQAAFSVNPWLALEPAAQLTGEPVLFTGTGFNKRAAITINLEGNAVETTPQMLTSDHYGSFEGSFIVPVCGSYGARLLEVMEGGESTLTVPLTVLGGITLSPATSPTSPGHVGMELAVTGSGFEVGGSVTVSYANNGEPVVIDTVSSYDGSFRLEFIIPPGPSGSHELTASDGISTGIAVFVLEELPPPNPAPLTAEGGDNGQTTVRFDWDDVSDDSGVSYDLQIGLDIDCSVILVNESGLEASEYTLSEALTEVLAEAGKEAYYWRVKAVDGAGNESQWSYPRLFFVGFSPAEAPSWLWYSLGGAVALVLGIVGLWLWKRRA